MSPPQFETSDEFPLPLQDAPVPSNQGRPVPDQTYDIDFAYHSTYIRTEVKRSMRENCDASCSPTIDSPYRVTTCASTWFGRAQPPTSDVSPICDAEAHLN